jgi:AbrB family looped-hinge helix DNA binding protein
MRITSKGQVTIPKEVRERFGLLPDTEVDFVVKGNDLHLVKSEQGKKPTRGEMIVSRMRGRLKGGMSTDEIIALMRN